MPVVSCFSGSPAARAPRRRRRSERLARLARRPSTGPRARPGRGRAPRPGTRIPGRRRVLDLAGGRSGGGARRSRSGRCSPASTSAVAPTGSWRGRSAAAVRRRRRVDLAAWDRPQARLVEAPRVGRVRGDDLPRPESRPNPMKLPKPPVPPLCQTTSRPSTSVVIRASPTTVLKPRRRSRPIAEGWSGTRGSCVIRIASASRVESGRI